MKAIQANQQIVAMTGDGVNVTRLRWKKVKPISASRWGSKGTEVTKEAAEMILTDDNFASDHGRRERGAEQFDNNIEKAILFMLPTNVRAGTGCHRSGNLLRLHHADHRASGPLGQHGHVCGVGVGDLFRTA